MRKFTESRIKPDYLSFPSLRFIIIRINISRSIITTIITSIVFVVVAVFSNFILCKLLLVF